jgi:phosphohistidine phosphatase SixA
LSLAQWGADQKEDMQKMSQKFSTGTIVSMTFDGDGWTSVNIGKGQLTHFAAPKMLCA